MITFSKKVCILLSVFSFLLFQKTFSQAPTLQWEKSYGGSKSDNALAIINTSDGGYAVVCQTISPDGMVTGFHHDDDFWIIKLDVAGVLQWQKDLGGNFDEIPFDIVQSADGGFVAAGETGSNDGDITGNHGANDFWVTKLNSAGSLVWQHTYGGINNEDAQALITTADGGYIVAGGTKSNGGQVTNNHGATDFWVIKIDSLGNLVWQKTYGNIFSDEAFALASTTDGGFIVAGKTQGIDGDLDEYNGLSDYMVVKADASGTVQWQKAYGGTDQDEAHAIYQSADGGYVIGGDSYSTDGDVTGNHGFEDIWIVKTDNLGNLLWQKSLGGSMNELDFSLCPAHDGGIIVAGSAASSDGDVTSNHDSVGYGDSWILELSSTGTLLWDESFGGAFSEAAHSIIPTPDGGYITAGDATSFDGDVSTFLGGGDVWVIKLEGTCTILPKAKITTPNGTDLCNNTVILKAKANSDYTYQWYKGNDAISGSTVKKYTPTSTGKYSYTVTSISTGCSNTSKKVKVTKSCKESETLIASEFDVTIHPNPNSGEFVLAISNLLGEDATVTILNFLGQVVYADKLSSQGNQMSQSVSLSPELADGIYYVTIRSGEQVITKQLVMQR